MSFAAKLLAMRTISLLLLALAALLPGGCTFPAANPFAGAWATADRQQIAFRDDTVVINPPGQPATPMGAESCAGSLPRPRGESPACASRERTCWMD